MSKSIKLINLLIVTLLMISCAPKVKTLSKDYKVAGSKSGVAVISLTQNNNYSIFHTYISGPNYHGQLSSRIRGSYLPLFEDEEFPWPTGQLDAQYMGRVLAIELEPGEYKIRKWEVRFGKYSGIDPIKYPKVLKLKINAGEVYYLGNIHMNVSHSNEVLPVIKDNYERDVAIFRRKYPKMNSVNVIKQIGYTGHWLPLNKIEVN